MEQQEIGELEMLRDRIQRILCELQRIQTVIAVIADIETVEQARYIAQTTVLQTTYFLPLITDCVPVDLDGHDINRMPDSGLSEEEVQ